jgi:hypothetical protein
MPPSLMVVPKIYPNVADIKVGETWDILPYGNITVIPDGSTYIDKNAETHKPDALSGVKVRRDEAGYHLILTARGTKFEVQELSPNKEWIPIETITEDYDPANPYNWLHEKGKG